MLDIDPLRDGPTPVPAATVILLRDGDGGPEVLLVQRHKATAFMGGAYVFPGGKLDPADAGESVAACCEALEPTSLQAALGPSESLDETTARALFVAAARETFEEAGILLGHVRPTTSERELADARARLNAKAPFDEVLGSLGATLALGRLVPLSRWVTPAVEKRRFDARFFLAHVTREESERASIEERETVASRWLTPAEALRLHAEAVIDLPPPTLRTLELLASSPSAAAAMASAKECAPPLVRPVFHALEEGWILALPGDPLHPETRSVLGGTTRFVCRDARWFSR